MTFHIGDPIMHWTFGLGKIIALEERAFSEVKKKYYVVEIKDMTIWVPVDDNLDCQLRHPTAAADFKDIFAILALPGEPLPANRLDRKTLILDKLKDGRAESLCQVISSLTSYQQDRSLNEIDQGYLKRARNALLEEWVYALAVSFSDAEHELRRLLDIGLLKTRAKH